MARLGPAVGVLALVLPAAALAQEPGALATSPLPPMWPDQVPVRDFARTPRHKDPAMMVAGIVVTSLGIATLPVCIGMMMPRAFNNESICPGCRAWLVVLPVGMIVPPAIGIPLWVNGSKSPGAWSASLVPEVTPASRTLALRWSL
jgi:hypothetical protein